MYHMARQGQALPTFTTRAAIIYHNHTSLEPVSPTVTLSDSCLTRTHGTPHSDIQPCSTHRVRRILPGGSRPAEAHVDGRRSSLPAMACDRGRLQGVLVVHPSAGICILGTSLFSAFLSVPNLLSSRLFRRPAGVVPSRRAFCLQAIVRAREVYLHSSSAAINLEFRGEALRLLDVSSAPKLQTLSIQSANMSRDSVPLSGEIFLRHVATALHVLTLAYCDIAPSSLLLRAPLVSLRLERCQVESPLEVLGLLPQLRTLVLENTHGTRLRDSSDIVHLPQLQQLELTNISGVVVFILKGIRPPASVSLSIMCTDYIDTDEPLDDATLLRTIVFTISPVLSTYLERALEEGYAFPLLEITTPTDTSKKTIALLDRTSPTPTTESCQLHFSVVWGDASGCTDLFSQMLSASPLPRYNMFTYCACVTTRYPPPTLGLVFVLLPNSTTRLATRPCGGCSPS